MDYKCFGDVMSFDTTFQTNKFEMPFALILGANHHKRTVIFGAALLYSETIESFVWLFETFLVAMCGKHPSTIFTDQDAAMAGAIAYVFTKRMYSEFEEEFKKQFVLSCNLVQTEGTNLTFMVTYMQSERGATVVFNTKDCIITCSCRKFESIDTCTHFNFKYRMYYICWKYNRLCFIGLLCKHALRVFNMNEVYNLPSHYILNRWTKYAKRGFYIEKQASKKEDLKTHAALISRNATSVALKCSTSKELLDDFQRIIEKFDIEADARLRKMQEECNDVPLVVSECDGGTLNAAISFKIPQVVKGPKNSRYKNVVEKNSGKKKNKNKNKSTNKKGINHPFYLFFPLYGYFYSNSFISYLQIGLHEKIPKIVQKREMKVMIQSN
jgi:hypothetical protein